jgi:hypothetical protein
VRALPLLVALIALSLSCSGSDDSKDAPSRTASTGERSTEDRSDDESGRQIHLVYALPSDGVDRELDTNGTIETSFGAAQKWLADQTGGRAFRLDTVDGEPDISFFDLSRSDADLQSEDAFTREAIEAELIDAGFDSPDKIYAVYYDGGSTYACGSGAYPPTIVGNVLVLFLDGTPLNGAIQCGENEFAADVDSPVFWEYVAVHEILHTLGLVPTCAPNEELSGHISGPPNDLMYEGEEETDLPKALDAGHDDYYKHDDSDCIDLDESPYLTS